MGRQNSKSRKKKFYRISLVENDTHKSLLSIKFSKPGIIVAICTATLVFIALIYSITAFTPVRKTIPGYPDAHSKKIAVSNAIKIDSLEAAITKWELYAENLSRVLSEEPPLSYDSTILNSPMRLLSLKSEQELRKQDSLLRENVMREEQFQVSNSKTRDVPIEGLHFFTPIKGVVLKSFDRVLHPAMDISAPKNSTVYAIYEGTVIYSGWDDEDGNVMIIQHPNNMLSVYEHGEKLMKNVGETVKAGDTIALVGSSGSVSQQDYLHFALWYNGEPLDPTKYINF